jgi:peptide/nickel transport system substrate-binding protein
MTGSFLKEHERMSDRPVNMSRRRFLKSSAGVGFSVIAAANGHKVVAQESTPAGTPVVASYQESPLVAEQVAAGALPPIEERLPKNPVVVTPTESIGTYGGTWRTALVGGSDTAWLARTIGYDGLVRWDPTWDEIIPNVAESYEISADTRSYTFKLREGMKWSDGTPFTSADIEFYVNDVYLVEELSTESRLNPFSIEVADETTFTVTYEKPNGFALAQMAQDGGSQWVRYPRHYLEQFHKTYNTTNLDQLIADQGAADWIELFRTKGGDIPGTPYNAVWQNPELPRLHAWAIVEPYGETTRVSASRNPYYWKVDTDGNQLPYIDQVVYDVLQDPEVLILKIVNGEVDFHDRHVNNNTNKPVFADALESAQLHFVETIPSTMNAVSIALNLNHKDPVTREIFQNIDFRIGLSHAINRQEVIDTIFVGQGQPWQLAPREGLPYYNETLAKQYTEYDVDLANQKLDAVLPNKDGDGKRLRSDGQKLLVQIEVATGGGVSVEQLDSVNLVASYWNEVGVETVVKPEDRSLLYTRKEANDCDCVIWGGDGGFKDAIYDPRWYFPFSAESNYAQAWQTWYNKPSNPLTQPEEPPEAARQQMDLYDQLKETPDVDEQNALFAQILDIAQQQFWAMGLVLPINGYAIVKNNFMNVPETFPEAYVFVTPGPTNPQQYYFQV